MSAWGDMRKRSTGDIIRTEDAWGGLSFINGDNPDPNKILKDPEIASITKAALAKFEFGGFSSLDEFQCDRNSLIWRTY